MGSRVFRLATGVTAERYLRSMRSFSVAASCAADQLRKPSGAVWGGPADVKRVLPCLHELSAGARRGTPGWVPQPEVTAPGPRKRSASWLEITYPFSTDAELRDLYMLADGNSLRGGRFLEELDAFSADCACRHADVYNPARPLTVVTAAHDGLSSSEAHTICMCMCILPCAWISQCAS